MDADRRASVIMACDKEEVRLLASDPIRPLGVIPIAFLDLLPIDS